MEHLQCLNFHEFWDFVKLLDNDVVSLVGNKIAIASKEYGTVLWEWSWETRNFCAKIKDVI